MTKIKLYEKKIFYDEKGKQHIITETKNENGKCIKCGQNERENGSSRCGECRVAFKKEIFERNRLKKRVEQAKLAVDNK